MSLGIAATVVGAAVTAGAGIYAANAQADAASKASKSQKKAAQAGIDEQRRQFDALQAIMKPYVDVGTQALGGQGDLAGLNGPEAQQRAIDQLQNSPQFSAFVKQGETGILQNASATGGLRGGDVQGTLAQYRPAMLNQLINDRYSQLSGLSAMGQNSAAGVGMDGQSTGNQVSNILGQEGAAAAGGALAQGQQATQYANVAGGLAGTLGGIDWSTLFPPSTGGGVDAGGAVSGNVLPSNTSGIGLVKPQTGDFVL